MKKFPVLMAHRTEKVVGEIYLTEEAISVLETGQMTFGIGGIYKAGGFDLCEVSIIVDAREVVPR